MDRLFYRHGACLILITGVLCMRALAEPTAPSPAVRTWYHEDATARSLSQVDTMEWQRLARNPLVDLRPVVLPHADLVVTDNDYFDWPIATMIDDTIIVLYDRRRKHSGGDPKEARTDENSGIRMIVRSTDGGRTWTPPVDVLAQAGSWSHTIFSGWGGGLGVHQGIVYLALNQGLYRSEDKGATWKLATAEPDFSAVPGEPLPLHLANGDNPNLTAISMTRYWSPGMRITFDRTHGLVVWTTSGFKAKGRDGRTNSDYGKQLVALYSPDFGHTWQHQEQQLPEGIYLNEITPLQQDGALAFLFRNGIRDSYCAQGYSATGWFPFHVQLTSIGPLATTDTPDIVYNPTNSRYEAAVSFRHRDRPMELRLFSIEATALARGDADWRSDGVLLRYRHRFGPSDGMNPVGSVIDTAAGMQRIYVWGGDSNRRSGIFQLSRSLDTAAVREALRESPAAVAAPPVDGGPR